MRITLSRTLEQTCAVRDALDLYARLGTGQSENTNQDGHTVDHEGVTVRYTQDPAPVAIVKNATSTQMTTVKTLPAADNGDRL